MIFRRAYFLPPLIFIILIGTFVITYIISISLDHVRAVFPYISDTGTIFPESTVFAQILNIGAVLIYIIFYIRCQEVKKLYSDPKLPRYSTVAKLNRISLWISLPIALGVSMTGNFQETTAMIPHLIGASLCFIIGMIYFWIHTFISYITCPVMNTLNMARLRLFFVIIGSLACFGTGLFGVISFINFKKEISDMPKWGPDDGGYELHLVSAFLEWITLIFYGLYILTFIRDFKDIVVQCPKIEKVSCTKPQQIDDNSNSANINPLEYIDRKSDDGNFGKAADLGRGGSKILLV